MALILKFLKIFQAIFCYKSPSLLELLLIYELYKTYFVIKLLFFSQIVITTTDPGGLVMIVTLTKHENTQTVQQQQPHLQLI